MEPDYVKLKEIKPVLAGYIREAQSLLGKETVPGDVTVHDVRVLMKKSRAVMKLIAVHTGRDAYERDYAAFREVGRILCTWRETSVHRKTLKDLRKKKPGIFTSLTGNKQIELLLQKAEAVTVPSPQMKQDIEKINDLLNRAGFRIRFMNFGNMDAKLLLDELENTYKLVMHRYLAARNNMKPENLHEFRKKAKDFLYQLYFFRPLNPPVVKAVEKRIDSITQNLGKFNDLTQLITALDYKYRGEAGTPAFDELVVIMRQEQDKYLSKTWPQAYKVFCPGNELVNLLGFRILKI